MNHEVIQLHGFGTLKVFETGTVIIKDSTGQSFVISAGMLKRLAFAAEGALVRVINNLPPASEVIPQ